MKNEMYAATIRYSDDDAIFIKPVCDFFGIDYKSALKSISKNEILKKSVLKKTSISQFGDNFERVAFKKEGFITWILQMNPQIVHQNLRDKLIEYQGGILEALYGSIRRDEELQKKYHRQLEIKAELKKLKAEYNLLDRDVNEYLEEKFGQLRLQLEGGKQ